MLDITLFKDFGRMSARDRVFGNIGNHDAAGLDDGTFTDRDAAQHHDAVAQPVIVFDDDVLLNVGIIVRDLIAFIIMHMVIMTHSTPE